MNTQLIESLMKLSTTVAMSLLVVYGCAWAADKQAELDYAECLSWQKDGYQINCTRG
ncbi:hypothetical protein SAMN02745664_10213 [Moraxella cuniculi DSM 21768]|uniref:Uncharacterized protein n=1 Tax=Moraxella cuniculi DSM 21768 TaxID=1122245 RepID=A0A1N7DPP8_9GAMM|nr:hypothetical protein [Moraxella cuniculi]SIR77741.1 hypothetical protein SAMN02745664_10213 [Moraxella cuniculi DSM 21768]